MTAARPRVLQLFSRDIVGGVQVLAQMIETGLTERGYQVESLSLATEGSLVTRVAHLGKVARRLLFGGYDAIFTYQSAAAIASGTLGRLGGAPVRLAHLTEMPEAIKPRWRLLDQLVGLSGGHTGIIANSTATQAAFAHYPRGYRDRMVLIPHGVAPLSPPARQVNWRARLGIPAAARVLVATGRLSTQKDHVTAVRALAQLPGMHLAIAGDGPERPALLALAAQLGVTDRLHLPGIVPHAALGDFLAMADLYLFPSVWETFGLAGVEAQMAGLPVIAADLPVLREVLACGTDATLRFHPAGDAAGLAEAVSAVLAAYPDAAERQAVAAGARARHGVATMIGRYLALLEPAPGSQGARHAI